MSRSKCHLCFSPEILTWRPTTEEKNQKRLRCHSDSGLCTFRLRQSTVQFSASCLVYWLHRWPNRSTGTGPALISCESYSHLVVSGTPWSINQSLPCVREINLFHVYVAEDSSSDPALNTELVCLAEKSQQSQHECLWSMQGEPKKPGPAGPTSGLDPHPC